MSDQKFNFTANDATGDLFCVFLSSLTYKPKLEIEKELREAGYPSTDVLFFQTHLTSGFIVRWADTTVIAFKGSTTWREWVNNCNVWLEPTQIGRIHVGFLNTVQHAGPILYRIIYADIAAGSKIVLTGHSRGGALACVFGYFLALNEHAVHRIVTFGAPKYCDAEHLCRSRGLPYEPSPLPPRWSFARVQYWLLGFRIIYIPVCLYLTLRFLRPAIRAHIAARLIEHAVVGRTVSACRRLLSVFRRARAPE